MYHRHMMHSHSAWSGPVLGVHLLLGMLILAVALSVAILLRKSAETWVAQTYGTSYAPGAGWFVLILVLGIAVLFAIHVMRG
jgi:uncharacterized membrane protein YkgB